MTLVLGSGAEGRPGGGEDQEPRHQVRHHRQRPGGGQVHKGQEDQRRDGESGEDRGAAEPGRHQVQGDVRPLAILFGKIRVN